MPRSGESSNNFIHDRGWQSARRFVAENPLDLPDCSPGTPIYLIVPPDDQLSEVRLRAYAREIRRAGRKVKVLGDRDAT